MTTKNNSEHKLCTKLIVIFLISFRIEFSSSSVDSSDKRFAKSATFHFPEYAYKETSKNEITYREFESACENSVTCDEKEGIEKINCVRKCVSSSCYLDIYAFDELEEGEIDVRLNSFKGCVIQRTTGNSHRM